MVNTLKSWSANFLGKAPNWYKATIIFFLILNPIIFKISPFVTGWVLILEFIFTLALALKCYPLTAGGLLAFQAVAIGMASPETVYKEALHNFPVIMLLMFMVAGIYFMKDLLEFAFTKILTQIKSKMVISLAFCFAGAFLSAFLDALTVTAVIISVAYGFFGVYHKYASKNSDAKIGDDSSIEPQHEKDLEQFRAFLRNLLMHGAVGTALGGVCTIVGEPQNLLIGHVMGWNFVEFAKYVAPVSVPVVIAGLTTCLLVEKFKIFGYGFELPLNVRQVLKEEADSKDNMRTTDQKNALVAQGVVAVLLILGLAFHVAEVGLIGLAVIVLLTTFTGVIEEHDFGPAFKEALPFTALLVVFFAIVAVIHEQHLFSGVIHYVLQFEGKLRNLAYYIANGLLSMISDNVFVATVYINETAKAFSEGLITRDEFEHLAVAINVGTNVPSVATPNGQAAFLFLLTSSLAPLIRLSYGAMVKLALPYTIVLSIVGGLATWYWL